MSLIRDGQDKNGLKQHQAKIEVESNPFGNTFGPKAQRKRVKLSVNSWEDLAGESAKLYDEYEDRLDEAYCLAGNGVRDDQEPPNGLDEEHPNTATANEPVFSKGKSRRIWNEVRLLGTIPDIHAY